MPNLDQFQNSMVVVVDDDPDSLDRIERILHVAGYQRADVPSPGEALEVIENEEIDLLVVNLHLPEIDGLNLFTRLSESILVDGFVPGCEHAGTVWHSAQQQL